MNIQKIFIIFLVVLIIGYFALVINEGAVNSNLLVKAQKDCSEKGYVTFEKTMKSIFCIGESGEKKYLYTVSCDGFSLRTSCTFTNKNTTTTEIIKGLW